MLASEGKNRSIKKECLNTASDAKQGNELCDTHINQENNKLHKYTCRFVPQSIRLDDVDDEVDGVNKTTILAIIVPNRRAPRSRDAMHIS
jgi:hypothetical protein